MHISYLVLDIAPMAVKHCFRTQICIVPRKTCPNWGHSLQGWRHNIDGRGAKAVSATAIGCMYKLKIVSKGLGWGSTKEGTSASLPSWAHREWRGYSASALHA